MNQAPQIAVFDCDEVLADLCVVVSAAMRGRGHDVHWRDWHTYDWMKVYGADAQSLQSILADADLLELAPPNPDGLAGMIAARASGLDAQVWTTRAWHPNGQEITEQYLLDFAGAGFQVRLAKFGQCKTELVRPGEQVVMFHDDSASQVRAMQTRFPSAWCRVVLRPWNLRESGVEFTSSVEASVAEFIASQGLLSAA